MSDSPSSTRPSWPSEWTSAWSEGITHFNGARYWHAHESWERGWLKLPAEPKKWIQGLIQVSGSFHLFLKGRSDPALRLAKAARLKFISVPEGPARVIEVPGLEVWLANPTAAFPRLQAFPRWL